MNPCDAPVPELAPKQTIPTLSDFRKFNRQFVTRVLPTVVGCGHKTDPELPPRRNCIYCWLTYFNSSAERVETWKEMLSKDGGEAELTAFYGSKYVKHLKKFIEATKEKNG